MVCETDDVTLQNFECQAGFYRVDDACKTCKDGMVCDEPGVTIENVRLEKQYWRTSAESAIEDGGVAAQLFVTFRGSLYSSTDDAADERRARPLFDMAGVWQLPGRRARHPPLCSSDWA